MSIGTAVPSEIELNEVKHHFIQHKSVLDPYTVYDFSVEANKLIKKLFKVYDNIILVGGSYMFLKSIIYGIDKIESLPRVIFCVIFRLALTLLAIFVIKYLFDC